MGSRKKSSSHEEGLERHKIVIYVGWGGRKWKCITIYYDISGFVKVHKIVPTLSRYIVDLEGFRGVN